MALAHVDLGRRADVYHTLRCHYVQRPADLDLFDDAFRVFWRRRGEGRTTQDLQALGEHRRTGRPTVEAPTGDPPPDDGSAGASPELELQQTAALSYSDREVLREKDFAQLTDEELDQARVLLAKLEWDLGQRRTRRWRPGRGRRLDLRRLVRANLRHGGELLERPTRSRRQRRRPLVLLCDVSGSMERYARMLLHFLYCMTGRLTRVEVFVFATRLTRVTRLLTRERGREAGRHVVPRVTREIGDYAGGTRIGEALATFNRVWTRRVLGHGAVVLVISDGWDRGDPDILSTEIARLHRSAHRLIWLNPLLGSPDYVPLTRGIRAALPHIDDFLPVHNLASLEQLGRHLNALPRRPVPVTASWRATPR